MAVITVQASTLSNIWSSPNATIPATPELRIGCSESYVAADGTQIQPYPFSYVPVSCSWDSVTGILSIPQFLLQSTLDGLDIQSALYTFYLFSGPGKNGNPLAQLRGLIGIPLAASPTVTNLPAVQLAARTNINVYPWNASATIAQIISSFYGAVPLPANNPTPSVINGYSFYTQNTVDLNITNFLNGYIGQPIYIYVRDNHTSIFGVHYLNGSFLTFGFNGTNWIAQSPASGIISWNGRVGVVVPLTGDYTAAMVTGAADLAALNQFSKTQTIFESNSALAAAIVLANNNSLPVTLQHYGSTAPGFKLGGLVPIANLGELVSQDVNLLIRQFGSNGAIWFATNDILRAKLSSVGLELPSTTPLVLDGATSGSAKHKAQPVAGDYTFLWPNTNPSVGNNLAVTNFAAGQITLGYQPNGGGGSADPAGISAMLIGVLTPSQQILLYPVNNSFVLSLTNSTAVAKTAATAQTDFLVQVNGVTKATIRFAAGATVATIVSPVSTIVGSGDLIEIIGPVSPDATLANAGFNLAGEISVPSATPVSIGTMCLGLMPPNVEILIYPANNTFTLGVTGSTAFAKIAATAQTDFLIKVNGVTKGTLRFAAGGTVASVVGPISTSIAPNDLIEIVGPAVPDVTLANVGFNLKGTT